MSPFREGDVPEDVQREVAVARVREAEETKRHETSQREQTKREKIKGRAEGSFAVVTLLWVAGIVALGGIGYAYGALRIENATPKKCIDSIHDAVAPLTCEHPDQVLQTWKINSDTRLACMCQRAPAVGSATP